MGPNDVELDAAACAVIFKALELKAFFTRFGPAEAAKLFPNSALQAVAHNARLVEEGQKGRDLFVVCAGKVSIFRSGDGEPEFLATMGPAQVFGEIGLLDGVRVASAVATGAGCRVFRLAHEDVERLLDHDARLAAHLKALARERLGAP